MARCLIVKASQKIKYMNQFIEGLRSETEEAQEKYDRLMLKQREMSKQCDHLQSLADVTQAQKENCEQEI